MVVIEDPALIVKAIQHAPKDPHALDSSQPAVASVEPVVPSEQQLAYNSLRDQAHHLDEPDVEMDDFFIPSVPIQRDCNPSAKRTRSGTILDAHGDTQLAPAETPGGPSTSAQAKRHAHGPTSIHGARDGTRKRVHDGSGVASFSLQYNNVVLPILPIVYI